MEISKTCIDCGSTVDDMLIETAQNILALDSSIVKISLRCRDCELKNQVERLKLEKG